MQKGKFSFGKFLRRLLGDRFLSSGILLVSSVLSTVNTGIRFHRNLKSREHINERTVYCLDEAASLMSLHPGEVSALIEKGHLTGVRFGNTYRILGRCIINFFEEGGNDDGFYICGNSGSNGGSETEHYTDHP